MLYLITARKERLEIPPACVTAVVKPCDGVTPGAIIFDLGFGAQFELLDNDYGYLKRSVVDCAVLPNPVEVRILEPVAGRDGLAEGLMFLSRERIVGRREVRDDPAGIRARLYARIFAAPTQIAIADTLDELDGTKPAAPPSQAQEN